MEAVGRLSGGVGSRFQQSARRDYRLRESSCRKVCPASTLRSSVDEILKAGKRAAWLTRQLLAFSRQQVLIPRSST